MSEFSDPRIQALFSQIAGIEAAAEAKQEILEDAGALGEKAVRIADYHRIAVGRLAGCIIRRYNEATMNTFAKRIQCGEKAVRSWENVVTFFGWATCVALLDELPNVSWTHLRAALRVRNRTPEPTDEAGRKAKLEADRQLALDLLLAASKFDWSTSETERKAAKKGSGWVRLAYLEQSKLVRVNHTEGTATFFVGDALKNLQDRVGQYLKLDVKGRETLDDINRVANEVQRDAETAGS